MSRQVKLKREKNTVANEIISKILEIKELELSDFAIKCGIAPDTMRQAIRRDRLSKDIVTKIHDTFGVRRKFLTDKQEPIFDENHTGGIKKQQADISNDPLVKSYVNELDALRKLVAVLERENAELRGKK